MKKSREGNIRMKVVRIAIVGYCSGKTTFIARYLKDIYHDESICSVECTQSFKILKLNNDQEIKLILWDTAGNERYKAFSFGYVRNAQGIIIMYDISNEKSFKDVLYWINTFRDYKYDIPILIIGNMCDVDDYGRVISKEEGEKLAKEYNYHFYESSNKLRINIEEPINDLVEQILKRGDEDKSNNTKETKEKKQDNKNKEKKQKKQNKEIKEKNETKENIRKIEIKNYNIDLNEKNFYSRFRLPLKFMRGRIHCRSFESFRLRNHRKY